ncbi:MAG: hypothetical protein QNJ11_09125 [Woeseiaceae bacterium]|nr:hypothetical protein [Woeseiaceae bacterium]
MNLLRCLIVFLLLLVPASAVPQTQTSDSYLCIPDQSTGFTYKGGEWQVARFNVAEEKYVLRKRKRRERHPIYSDSRWLIFRFGETTPAGGCDKGFDRSGLIHCSYYLYGDFRMNRDTGRYQATYWPGYVDSQGAESTDADRRAPRDGDDTPSITIGRCSAI